MHRPYESRYDAIVDPFQTLPDGLDDPYMLLYAFTRLARSSESSNAGRKHTNTGTRRIRATSKVRMLANAARTALNLNGSAVARSLRK
jgi:hypothetical protein